MADDELNMKLLEIVNELTPRLRKDDLNNITEFIEHNEWGLAYETLCTQVFEYDIPITNSLYKKIDLFGQLCEMDSSIWLPLKSLINHSNNLNNKII